jgi:uncharacterized protein (TIGR03435 family)
MKIVLAAIAAAALLAQTTGTRPSFEVAAIKRNPSIETEGRLAMQPGGHFRAINFDTFNLIAFAYRTKLRNLFPSQIVGAPDWLKRERFDINANIGSDLVVRAASDPLQTPKLVQSLLEDRFKLRAHRETRELPVYELVVLRKDGTLGAQMHRVDVDCDADRARCIIQSLPGQITARGLTIETLAAMLSSRVERLVVDRTGLAGSVDIALDWSPDQSVSDKPSLFTAVQEQLGLRLDSKTAPVDVVVIDHIERPTED